MSEIWKDINNYENLYKVSNLGNIFSIKNNKLLSLWKDKDGYLLSQGNISMVCNGIKNNICGHIFRFI